MTSRVTEVRLPALGKAVREVAAELTLALGGVMPETKSSLSMPAEMLVAGIRKKRTGRQFLLTTVAIRSGSRCRG